MYFYMSSSCIYHIIIGTVGESCMECLAFNNYRLEFPFAVAGTS